VVESITGTETPEEKLMHFFGVDQLKFVNLKGEDVEYDPGEHTFERVRFVDGELLFVTGPAG
jgi:hypothetical protein